VEETITNIVAKIQNGRNPTTAPASLQRPKPTSPQPPSTITSIPSTFPSTSPQPSTITSIPSTFPSTFPSYIPSSRPTVRRRLPHIRTKVEETITNIVAKIQNKKPTSTITSIPSTFPSYIPSSRPTVRRKRWKGNLLKWWKGKTPK